MGAQLREPMFRSGIYAIGDIVKGAIGILLIMNSRQLAEYWFKGENE